MEQHAYVAAAQAAMDTNMARFYGAYASVPGKTLIDRDGNILFYTGIPHPLFNGAIIARDERGDILAFETRLAEEIARHHAPALWWIASAAHTPAIENRLSALGLKERGTLPAMACALARLAPPGPLPGLHIEEAADAAARADWAALAARATGFSPEAAQALCRLEEQIPPEALRGQRRFTASLDGQPVATASTVVTGTVAGLYAVATLPEARGRGIAGALSLLALGLARDAGALTGVLQASDMGRPVYRRLGFAEISDYLLFQQG
ncbi:GNAT family N-acetyltransferase [Halovulum dunhuangense]|uniref:GNAT family N-acetyltransferase n=1 Tax=Halovulum dunhuangense TaxID=1505036 RepID=A0A849L1U3_9RHOB|nr:GNAT family N-acetyltransferase [Halovulum dunhuangense]NNU80219.1 GNAT family N-acetyltransferase [Halovulum dunhuangense]